MTQWGLQHFKVRERGERPNQRVISEEAPARSVFQRGRRQNDTIPERIAWLNPWVQNPSDHHVRLLHLTFHRIIQRIMAKTTTTVWTRYSRSSSASRACIGLWMWNTIMHETGSMSVSYEPAKEPLVDKSPQTGVQEFGGLMKKSWWAGRSWSARLWVF